VRYWQVAVPPAWGAVASWRRRLRAHQAQSGHIGIDRRDHGGFKGRATHSVRAIRGGLTQRAQRPRRSEAWPTEGEEFYRRPRRIRRRGRTGFHSGPVSCFLFILCGLRFMPVRARHPGRLHAKGAKGAKAAKVRNSRSRLRWEASARQVEMDLTEVNEGNEERRRGGDLNRRIHRPRRRGGEFFTTPAVPSSLRSYAAARPVPNMDFTDETGGVQQDKMASKRGVKGENSS
jgi:hypothetical protein